MKQEQFDRQIREYFLLEPAITARAQEAYFRLSLSPVATLMVDLVELYRDQMIQRRATEELVNPDYRSRRQVELEDRAFEAEREGRRCWALNMKHQAGKHWARADRLWEKVDEITRAERVRLRALDTLTEEKPQRRKAAA